MLKATSSAPSTGLLARGGSYTSGSFMSKLEQSFKTATGSLMSNLFSKKAGSSSQENAFSALPLLSERSGPSQALRESRKTLNQANITSSAPRAKGLSD